MASKLAERIVDALADAEYIRDDLATSPDRFPEIVAVVDRVLEMRLVDMLDKTDAPRG